jgi:phosphomannomutase
MGASGYVLVREKMLAEGAPLAGEMSGHIFFGDRWHFADDGLYVACRALGALARSGRSLAEFRRSLPRTFATPELRFACADERKAEILGAIAASLDASAIDCTDGLRVTDPEGWWLLRASGTEPKLTARIEADSPEALERMTAALDAHLRVFGVSLP